MPSSVTQNKNKTKQINKRYQIKLNSEKKKEKHKICKVYSNIEMHAQQTALLEIVDMGIQVILLSEAKRRIDRRAHCIES